MLFDGQVLRDSLVLVGFLCSHVAGSSTIMAHYHAGECCKRTATCFLFYLTMLSLSAALNHPNFWKNYLESADALRLMTELGWPIPPSFEDTLIHAFTNLTATTPSIVEHTLCAILKALGDHLSTPSYADCCVQLCIKHSDSLLTIAERHANELRKIDSSIILAVPQFVSKTLTSCPSLVEVIQEPNTRY